MNEALDILTPFAVWCCNQQSASRGTISRIGWDIGKDRVCTKKSEVRFTVEFTVKRRGGGMVKEGGGLLLVDIEKGPSTDWA